MLAQYTQWCYLSQRVMIIPLTLKVTTAQVVKTPVTVNRNSPIQDYVHADNHTQPTYEKNPGFKPFTVMIMMEIIFRKSSTAAIFTPHFIITGSGSDTREEPN